MNKLSALYKMVKEVREHKPTDTTLTGEAILGEMVLGTLKTELLFGPDKMEKNTEFHCGEETFKFEYSGAGHKGLKTMHMHHRHGMGHGGKCCGPMNKLDRALFMIKVLDKLEYIENNDETGVFTLVLKMEDMPEKIQESMKHRCCEFSEHHTLPECCPEGAKSWLTQCGCMNIDFKTMAPESLKIQVTVKEDKTPVEASVQMVVKGKDKEGNDQVMTVNLKGNTK